LEKFSPIFIKIRRVRLQRTLNWHKKISLYSTVLSLSARGSFFAYFYIGALKQLTTLIDSHYDTIKSSN